jgi:hypothetical protein
MKKTLSCLMFAVVLLVLGHGGAWGQACLSQSVSCQPSANFRQIMDNTKYGYAARLICKSEGSCDASGNITNCYCGHGDSNRSNIGLCSNTRVISSTEAADNSCLNDFIIPGKQLFDQYAATTNIDPTQRDAIIINFIDLYVQSHEAAGALGQCINNPNLYTAGNSTPWTVPPTDSCGGLNGIDPNNRILRARICTYIVPSTGRLKYEAGGINCTGQTPDQCSKIWCEQSGRMSKINGGGSGGNFPSLTNEKPQNVAEITCFSCPLIKIIVKIAADLGEDIFNGLRETLISLIGIVIALIMMYKIGTLFLPFGPTENVSKVINQVTYLAAVGIMLSVVLSSMSYFWQYVYIPVLQASVDISDVVLRSTAIEGYASCPSVPIIGTVQEQNNLLAERIECQTKNIVEGISQGIRVGWAMIASIGNYPIVDWNGIMNLIKRVLLLFSAIPIIAVYFYATLKFLFSMIDVVWRWTFVSMISPIMIASFATKQTRSFFSFGMKAMFESLIAFSMMSIVAAVTASLIANVDLDSNYKSLATLNTPDKYIKAIQAGNVYAPTINRAAFWNITFIGLLCGGLMFQCRDIAGKLVSSMTGGASGQFGESILNRGSAGSLLSNTLGRAASGDEQNILQGLKNERQEKAYPTPPSDPNATPTSAPSTPSPAPPTPKTP